MKKLLLVFSLLLAHCNAIWGQLLPPNQPEQDIINALVFCGTSFTTNYAYQGRGTIYDLPGTPCGGGEDNTVWLKVSVNTPGDIVFEIRPLITTDDYDFAVIKLDGSICGGITSSNVIRCNFNNNQPGSNVNGIVGLNLTSTVNTVAGGSFGTSYLQKITAVPGEVYLIMVNNFGYYTGIGGPSSGFTIDFAGSTALFNQPENLKFDKLAPYCNKSNQVILELNDYVQCASIAPDGSDFMLAPTGVIASASGIGCSPSSGFTKQVKLVFGNTLANGDYTLKAKTGVDLNTLIGICGAALELPDSLNFHVGLDNPIAFTTIDSPACQNLTLHFNTPFYCNSLAANGSDYKITGPSSVNIASAVVNGCTCGFAQSITLRLTDPIAVDGIYNVVSQIGSDGNTLIDSCGRIQGPGNSISFKVNSFNGKLIAKPVDTTVCNIGEVIQLSNITNAPAPTAGFNYEWSPTTGINYPLSGTTALQVPDMRNHYILKTVDSNGCVLRDSLYVEVKPFHATLTPMKTEICDGDTIMLKAGEGVAYKWYNNSTLTSVVSSTEFTCDACPNPKVSFPLGVHDRYVLVTSALGCRDTLHANITVNPSPQIQVTPRDTLINYGDDLVLYATGGTFYNWSPSTGISDSYSATPLVAPKKPTHFVVTGTNQYGCLNYDTAFVDINFRIPTQLPNAFSPNGDGLNDVFKVNNLKYQKLLAFRVYDRWGKLIFETLNPDKGWDGTVEGNPVNSDVYYYFIQLGFADNYVETLKGDVTLIR
jgi:gliding motility-associated-like protein